MGVLDESKGILFEDDFVNKLKEHFYYVDSDPDYGRRLFFDNSGGSFRLKKAAEAKARIERFPDCPERGHKRAQYIKGLVKGETKEILDIVFGASGGALMTELTASQCMFQMVGIIMQNIPGSNAVVSVLEHPSAYDAIEYYCNKTGKEMRVVPANPVNGKIEPEEVEKYVDENTCILSIMSASNVTGGIMDIKEIVRRARAIKPDLYIVTDAVQHAPHHAMDVEELGVDGCNFAPYKFFGIRGVGYAYVSDRVAKLPHHKLLKKDQRVFELGTPSPGNFAAMSEVISYVCEIGKHFIYSEDRKELYREGMRRIHLQERALLYRMLEGTDAVPGLRHIDGVKVFTDDGKVEGRDLIAGIGFDGVDLTEAVAEYQRRGVTVFDRVNTNIYSKRIVEAIGTPGLIRVSPLHCNSAGDIDEFLRITKSMAEMYRA